MIEPLQEFPNTILAFACRGQVTREDYETVLVPAVEAALASHERIRLYYQLGPDFEGISPGAMIDDFKVGVEHLTRWERIALVSDVAWIRNAARIFGFLFPARLKVFHLDEADDARQWIAAP